MRKITNKFIGEWAIACVIVFLQAFIFHSFAANSDTKEECILIINANADLAPLSNFIISDLIHKLPVDYKGTKISSENLNLMRVQNEQQMDTVRRSLFAKYENSQPKLIILMGANTWVLIHEELEKHWQGIPIVLFAEKEYVGSVDAYLQKYPIAHEEQISLRSILQGRNMTLVYAPFYVKETLGLMYQQIPVMNELIFISDRKWFSAQNRQEVAQIVVKYYPDLKLRFFTEGQKNIEEVVSTLRQTNPNTGILYAAWEDFDIASANATSLTRSSCAIGKYAVLPVFTLSDMGGQAGVLGGYYSLTKDISKTVSDVGIEILKGKRASEMSVVKVPSQPVLNYEELLLTGLNPSLCPQDTFFYHKPESFIGEHKYLLGAIGLMIVFAIALLLLRIHFLSNIRRMQVKQIQLMSNYDNLFNDMPIAYLQCRLLRDDKGEIEDYEILNVNPSFERHFFKKEVTFGKRGSVLNNPETYAKLKDYMDIANKKHQSVSFPIHATNNHDYDVIVMATNEPDIMNIFCHDTTELTHTRQSLRTINHKLSMALSMADISPWKWNIKDETVWFDENKSFENNNGFEVKEGAFAVPLSRIQKGVHPDDIKRAKRVFRDLLEGKIKKINEKFRVYTALGAGYEWLEVWAVVDERNSAGEPLTVIGSALVITVRKQMEEELIAAKEKAEEANRLKSAFIANMSHEIRTPLNAIVGFSSVLASAKTEKERKEFLHIIEHNNQLLLQLINDIIDLSKIEAGIMDFIISDISLDELMTELERSFRLKLLTDKVLLQFDDLDSGYIVKGDRSRIMQVMNNLISNAIKFTTEGSIHFGFTRQSDESFRFYVTDTGTGVPKSKQKEIFNRFVKLNSFAQGIGLGLSISETIVRHMGGEMGVVSEEGHGATFWFTITFQDVKKEL